MKPISWIPIVCASVAVTGCGMKGPLYLPDKNASVVTRPAGSNTTTPPAQTAPGNTTSPAPVPGSTTPPSSPKQPQDKSKDDSQSTSSTPKN